MLSAQALLLEVQTEWLEVHVHGTSSPYTKAKESQPRVDTRPG